MKAKVKGPKVGDGISHKAEVTDNEDEKVESN